MIIWYSKTPIYRAPIYRVPRFTGPISFPPKFAGHVSKLVMSGSLRYTTPIKACYTAFTVLHEYMRCLTPVGLAACHVTLYQHDVITYTHDTIHSWQQWLARIRQRPTRDVRYHVTMWPFTISRNMRDVSCRTRELICECVWLKWSALRSLAQ